MTDKRRYTVNLNPDRPHTVHDEHPWEVCNTDSADKKVYLDRVKVDELLGSKAATLCEHCLAEGLPDA